MMNFQSNDLTSILDQVRSEFNFEVVKRPLVGSLGSESVDTAWFGCFRNDSWRPVGPGSVKEGYCPHTTDDVVTLVEAAIGAFDRGVTNVVTDFNDGHFVKIMPSRETMKLIAGEDVVYPCLLVQAGYGGGGSFKCTLGLERPLCSNMEIFETVKSIKFCHKHTRNLRSRISYLRESFAGLNEGWVNVGKAIDRAAATKVSIKEMVLAVYGEPSNTDRSRTMHMNRMESIVERLFNERHRGNYSQDVTDEDEANAWEMYNAIQGYQQHNAIQRGKRSELQRAILANNSPAVKTAERLLIPALAA